MIKVGVGMWLHGVVKDNGLSHRVLNKPVTQRTPGLNMNYVQIFLFKKVLLRAEKNTNSEYYID